MQGKTPNGERRRVLAQFESWLQGFLRAELNAMGAGLQAPAEGLLERVLESFERGCASGRAFIRYADRGQPSPVGPLMVTLGKEGAVIAGALLPISGSEERDGFHGTSARFRGRAF